MYVVLGFIALFLCFVAAPKLCSVAGRHLEQDHVVRFTLFFAIACCFIGLAAFLLVKGILSIQSPAPSAIPAVHQSSH